MTTSSFSFWDIFQAERLMRIEKEKKNRRTESSINQPEIRRGWAMQVIFKGRCGHFSNVNSMEFISEERVRDFGFYFLEFSRE